MDARSWTCRRRVLGGVLAVAASAAVADETPGPAQKVDVTLRLLFTPTGAATRPIAEWGPFGLAAGESLQSLDLPPFAFGAGATANGCGAGVGSFPVETLLERNGYSDGWTADAKVLEAATDRLVLSASWKRYARGADGRTAETAGQSIPRLTLREGERVLLDYVVPARDGQPRCALNYALELEAGVREDPSLADRQIGYDVWLVDDAASAGKTTWRTQLTARQGEKLPFAFPKRRIESRGKAPAPESLDVAVTGELRGRVRADGRVELSVRTTRSLSYLAADGSSDGGVSDGGEKTVHLRPGETIRIEMPPPDRSPARNDPRVPRMANDLTGHAFALILTAKPI